jgi:hypothetical protein
MVKLDPSGSAEQNLQHGNLDTKLSYPNIREHQILEDQDIIPANKAAHINFYLIT